LFTIRQLLDAGGVDPNPARAARMVRSSAHSRIPDCLDYREDVLLLRAARRPWQTDRMGVTPRPLANGYAYAIYLLIRFFGLRPDEAQYLTWEDVHPDRIIIQAKRIDPSETHERFPDGWWKPKDYELRAIEPPHSRVVITELQRTTPHHGRFVVGGAHVLYDVQRPIKKLLTRIGSKRSQYVLGHTFATWALTHYRGEPGEVLVRVQRWMGHSSLATTMRYLHAVPRPEPHSILRHFATSIDTLQEKLLDQGARRSAKPSSHDKNVNHDQTTSLGPHHPRMDGRKRSPAAGPPGSQRSGRVR